jgi:hypothetical protein
MAIKEMEGEWKRNAQYEGGLYFERAPKVKKSSKSKKA